MKKHNERAKEISLEDLESVAGGTEIGGLEGLDNIVEIIAKGTFTPGGPNGGKGCFPQGGGKETR